MCMLCGSGSKVCEDVCVCLSVCICMQGVERCILRLAGDGTPISEGGEK